LLPTYIAIVDGERERERERKTEAISFDERKANEHIVRTLSGFCRFTYK